MMWRSTQLGEVITLKRGHDLPESARVDGAIPVVSSSGITGYHNVAAAQPPGIVTGRYGTLGEVFYIEEPYWPLNTALYAIDLHGNDPLFCSYFLRTVLRRTRSDKAAVPGVNRNDLHKIPVRVPNPKAQENIAAVLKRYDDLIGNNRRRIALLQQAARLLYEEWFVHFRFPGHDHAKFINGLPEGWEQRKFGSILTLQRGFDLPSASRIDGDVPVYGSTGVLDHHNVSKVTVPTVITGRSGSLGQVCYADQPCWPLNTCLWVKEFKGVSPYFAYHLLKAMDLSRMNGGASVPTLDRKAVHRVDVVLPTSAVLSLFDEYVSKIFSGQKILNQQNEKLTQTRDLLLPRLMSGEVEV